MTAFTKKQTDLEEIKRKSKLIFDLFPIQEVEELSGLGIVSHPYTTMMASMDSKRNLLDLSKPDDVKKFRENIFRAIDNCAKLGEIYMMLNTPYKLFWFAECSAYMSREDYGRFLSSCWVESENPNQDANVSLDECVDLFLAALPEILMDEDELAYFQNLPEVLTVYRGVSPGRERNGLSWTDDREKAEWFKSRFEREGKRGELLKAKINKRSILAYFNSRNEKELVVDVFDIEDKIERE